MPSGAGSSRRIAELALALAIMLVAAKAGGHLAVRLGQLAVLGELLAGAALGNLPGLAVIGWLRDDASVDIVAQLGSLILLFEVGLALSVRDVMTVRGRAAGVALLGTVFSLGFGCLASATLAPSRGNGSWYPHVFLGAALAATSIGITARVLRDLSKMQAREARIILGAAVLDDVLGLVILAMVTGWIAAATHTGGGSGHVPWGSIGSIVLKAVGFFAGAFAIGIPTAPWLFAAAARLRTPGAQVAAGLTFCFVLAWAADALGLAGIVGAFTAGLILTEAHSAGFVARGERGLAELVEPVSSFLVPVFFVLMGMRVNLGALANAGALATAGGLLAAAILGKLACGGALLGARDVSRLAIVAGMMPRGEVTLIYANLGQATYIAGRPLLDQAPYSALVLVIVATTLATPPALKRALRNVRRGKGDGRAESPRA